MRYSRHKVSIKYLCRLSMTYRPVVMASGKYNYHVNTRKCVYFLTTIAARRVVVEEGIVRAPCPPLKTVAVPVRLVPRLLVLLVHVMSCRVLDPAGRNNTSFIPAPIVQEELPDFYHVARTDIEVPPVPLRVVLESRSSSSG